MAEINIACDECKSDLEITINDGEIVVEPCNCCQELFDDAISKIISEDIKQILTKNGIFSYNLIVLINNAIIDGIGIIRNLDPGERERYNENHDELLMEVP